MAKLVVPILVESLDRGLAACDHAFKIGADLVEFRVDAFTDDLDALPQLVERAKGKCIVTCRPRWEGGEFDGDDAERLTIFEAACSGEIKPALIDVELVTYQRSEDFRRGIKRFVKHPGQVEKTPTKLILSTHDFETRPIDLYQRIEAMSASSACSVMKLAWKSRSLRDNAEAFRLCTESPKPMIALCMGETGLPSRVLAAKYAGYVTFAASAHGAGTAIGQPTIDELRNLYRWDSLQPPTKIYGVIGWPIGHSMSPAFHNAAFNETNFDGVYLPMPIPPEYEHFKATMLTWLNDLPDRAFRGASVTIPHKENLLRFVEEQGGEIEPLAKQIGAANTLVVRDDESLYACNTDYAAALDAVCDGMKIKREELAGKRVAVIGAGGAARAIVAGFAHYGATVVVYNRTFEKADTLAQAFNGQPTAAGGESKVVAARLEKLCDSCCHVFINCTPIGMHPNVDDTPIPTAPSSDSGTKGWGPDTLVFDTVYNPLETRLLREAKAAGCKTVTGLEMFIRQGAAQFELWTGETAPIDSLRELLAQRLAAQS